MMETGILSVYPAPQTPVWLGRSSASASLGMSTFKELSEGVWLGQT